MGTPRQPKPSCELAVRVTPRSSRNKLERSGDQLKIWVMQSPTDGQANEAVCALVAKTLGLAASTVSIKRGRASRDKVLAIEGLNLAEALERLSIA